MFLANNFSWGVASLHSLDSVFGRTEKFNFNEIELINSSMDCAIGAVSKKLEPNSWSSRFSPMLFTRSFIVLCFTFRSVIRFELNSVKGGCEVCV